MIARYYEPKDGRYSGYEITATGFVANKANEMDYNAKVFGYI